MNTVMRAQKTGFAHMAYEKVRAEATERRVFRGVLSHVTYFSPLFRRSNRNTT